MMRRLIPALLCLLLAASPAFAWWNPEWTGRKTIVIDTTASGLNLSTPVSDIPVLLRLHSGNFPQFLNSLDGGADFRLIAGDDQTPLKYHVEKFDAASQIAYVWVKIPTLMPQSKDNTLYLYFGNQTAPKGEDAGNTYDVDTAAAFHFGDPTGLVTDSTAYATPVTGTVISNPASLIGNGATLGGTEALQIQDAPNLRIDPDKGWGVGLWVKFDALPTEPAYLLDRLEGEQRLSVLISTSGQLVARFAGQEITAPTPVAVGQWAHVALVVTTAEMELFVNGASAGKAAITAAEMGGPLSIGGGSDGSGLLTAQLDELRVFASARTLDFVLAQAALEGERNDAVISYGADETTETAGGEGGEAETQSHFGTIIQYVFGQKEAIVEQIVIYTCILMAAVAIMVMFLKAVSLSRCRRATNRFLKAYRTQVTADTLDALVKGQKTFGDSPLFKLYEQGIAEVRARQSPSVGAASTGLDERALGAIRATLDATLVRENQRINSLLVLLTIAISGGPFIGLLGTVVGVMVTFATIAATGDVNISAIAPGMAAALLATVAGLGVAIPALFGYNYLGSQAKDLVADMTVFADEFVARLNEVHGA
jgi:biopolymer transport protein ExbB